MSSRWRERKGTFVSSAELKSVLLSLPSHISRPSLQAPAKLSLSPLALPSARRSALLAPVQKFRRAWVQVSPESSYKVLKWVPRHSILTGIPQGPSQIDSFLDHTSPSDPSSDEDDDDGPDHDGSELIHPLPPSHSPSAHLGPPDNPIRAREFKMTRKTSKAVEHAARVGGQLAGLETGEIVEQVALDDDDDDDDPAPDRAPPPAEHQSFPLRTPPPPSAGPSSAFAVQQPARLPASQIADVTMHEPTAEDDPGPFGPFDQQPEDVEMVIPEPAEPAPLDRLPDGPAGPTLPTAPATVSEALHVPSRLATPIAGLDGPSGQLADAPSPPQPPASHLPPPDPRSGTPPESVPELAGHQSPSLGQTTAAQADSPSVHLLSIPASSAHLIQPGPAGPEPPAIQLTPHPHLSTSFDGPGCSETIPSGPQPPHGQPRQVSQPPPALEPRPDSSLDREMARGAGRMDEQPGVQTEASVALEPTVAVSGGGPVDQPASQSEAPEALDTVVPVASGGLQLELGPQIGPSVALEPATVVGGNGAGDQRASRIEAADKALETMSVGPTGGSQPQPSPCAALEPAQAVGGNGTDDQPASQMEVSDEPHGTMVGRASGVSQLELDHQIETRAALEPAVGAGQDRAEARMGSESLEALGVDASSSAQVQLGHQIDAHGSLGPPAPAPAGIDSSPKVPFSAQPGPVSFGVLRDAGRAVGPEDSVRPEVVCAMPSAAALESLAARLSQQIAGPVESVDCQAPAASGGVHAGADEGLVGGVDGGDSQVGRAEEEVVGGGGHAGYANGEREGTHVDSRAGCAEMVFERSRGAMYEPEEQYAGQEAQANWDAERAHASGAGMETTGVVVGLGGQPGGSVDGPAARDESGGAGGQGDGHGQIGGAVEDGYMVVERQGPGRVVDAVEEQVVGEGAMEYQETGEVAMDEQVGRVADAGEYEAAGDMEYDYQVDEPAARMEDGQGPAGVV